MPYLKKIEHGKTLIRVPAGLKRKLEDVVFKSPTVMSQCPFGHDAHVTIQISYVPKCGPSLRLDVQIQRKRVPLGPQLVQSTEHFGEEYFEMLLRAPLQIREKRFVRFFQARENKPTTPFHWMKNGFKEMREAKAINSLCRRHRLGISFAETGEYDSQKRTDSPLNMNYKFYVLERPTKKARK